MARLARLVLIAAAQRRNLLVVSISAGGVTLTPTPSPSRRVRRLSADKVDYAKPLAGIISVGARWAFT